MRRRLSKSVDAFRAAGGHDLVLLHCVSGYPTPVDQSNLRRIPEFAAEFGCPIGLSDHTFGVEVAIASVALGACLIEKHFTLRRADGGPDSPFSLEPDELRALVHGAKAAFDALGTGAPVRSAVEGEVWSSAARSTSCAMLARANTLRRRICVSFVLGTVWRRASCRTFSGARRAAHSRVGRR